MAARLNRMLSAYWFRCAVVSLGAGVLVSMILSAAGVAPFHRVLPRALVHSAVMGSLVGSILPQLARRLIDAGAARGWTVILLLLIALSGLGTGVACGVLDGPFQECVGSAFQVNLILSLALGVGMTFYELQRGRADRMTLEARLASLEARLHPHFLFNTLNAIAELVHEDPVRAERTVERLATLLRASLDATGRGLVPLAQELDLVRDYLEIEKERLGARLAYDVAVPSTTAAWLVPPLAVQTLVENSIKHAIAPRASGGRVRVDAAVDGERVIIGVWDDGPGFANGASVPGHGLDNLEGRLAARFGEAAALAVSRKDGGTLVTITLPRAAPASG
jgi:signal transduction histidine kinase